MKPSYYPIQSSDKLKYPRKEFPSVEIIIHPTVKGEKRDDARDIEAHGIASRIKEIVSLPKKELAKWGRKEPFSYGDVAVLFRSSPVIKIYEGALKAQRIPYTVSKGSGFFRSREFIDALSLLQVIDNSEQDIPMAAVLRSPFVDINDDTLFILKVNSEKQRNGTGLARAIHHGFKIDGLANAEREKIEKFSRLLTVLRALRKSSWPDELIEHAIKETSYELKVLAQDDGLQKLTNIKKVIRFLREFRPETTGSLYDTCRFMETARQAGINEKEAPLAPEGREAVNLMTIHGAKGLEFPVVILADMGRDLIPAGKGSNVYVREDLGICCKHHNEDREKLKNIGYILSSEHQKERQKLEEYRLLYVAMTRTREHLILAGSCDFSKELSMEEAKSPMQIVCAVLKLNIRPDSTRAETIMYNDAHIKYTVAGEMDDTPAIYESPTLADKYKNEIASGLIITDMETDKKLTELLARRLDYTDEPLPEKPLTLSITSMLEYRQCPARYYFKYDLGLPEEVAFLPRNHGGTTGPELGSKIHALLNLIDFKKDLNVQLPELFRAVDISPEVHEEAVQLLQNLTNSPLYAELQDADELRRELPFSLRLGDVNLSGAIDILFQQADGKRVLMDYKTDDLDEAGAKTRSDSYFFQLSLYALAAKRTLGFVPHTIMLYFLRLNAFFQKEVNGTFLENAKNEAMQIAASIREEKFPLVKSSRCYSCAYGNTFCAILESRA
jgi:ATP-dependent helicase/nuclease subunit A